MSQRWYPKGKPPSGAELWRLLQEEIPSGQDQEYLTLTDGGKDAVGSLNYYERKCSALERELRAVRQQLVGAQELISRAANIYLRYYRWRHVLLTWLRRQRAKLRELGIRG